MASVSAVKMRVFCAHCGEMVSRRTFYAHKKEYYDQVSCTWTKKLKRDLTQQLSPIDIGKEVRSSLSIDRSLDQIMFALACTDPIL